MDCNTITTNDQIGIYKIKNIINGKVYIGQSRNIDSRKKEHLRDLKAGRHHNFHLQRAFDKYGESNFTHDVLVYCELDELEGLERHYIKKYDAMNRLRGYNLKEGSSQSADVITKMLESRKKLLEDKNFRIQMSWARSEISEQQVIRIKEMLFNDVTIEDICKELNVTYNQVKHIKHNNSFTFILPQYNYYIKNRESIYRERMKKVVISLYREGYGVGYISDLLNVNIVTPHRIIKEIATIHDERCRKNNIFRLHAKRSSLVKTLYNMGYSALKVSRTLKVAKGIVYAILQDKCDVVDTRYKLNVYKYKKTKAAA